MGLFAFNDSGYGDELLSGAFVTIRLAIYSFALAIVVGLLLTYVALARQILLKTLWSFYSSVLMGVPSVLIVFVLYYNSAPILAAVSGKRVDVSAFAAGLSALALVYSVYVAHVLRGAILMIPRGQTDAAASLGFHKLAVWWFIVLPQAWRLALPGLTNVWMILLKDTALVSLVGLTDLVRVADVTAAITKKPFQFYLAAGAAYIVFSALTMYAASRLEARANRGY